MRYKYLRSLLRTALAVGLVTLGHQHLHAVGLGSLNQPHAGVCFIHDLDWEPFAGSHWKLEDERSLASSSIMATLSEAAVAAEPTSNVHEQQAASALATAQMAIAKEQAHAVLEALKTNASFWGSRANRCLAPIVQLPAQFDSAVVFGSVRLVEWLQVAEVTSVTTFEANASQNDFADDAACEWDCSDWYSSVQSNAAKVFPSRDRANTFVFKFDALQTDLESIEPTVVGAQGGMDPVCPEIHSPVDSLCWADVSEKPRVCCPVDQKMLDDAIATSQRVVAQEQIIPPTLESDLVSVIAIDVLASLQADLCVAIAPEQVSDSAGVGHCIIESQHTSRHASRQEEVDSANQSAGRDWPMDYATRLVGNELPMSTPNWMDKTIWSRGWCDSNPMQQRTSYIGRYTREDLQYANQVSAKIFNPAQIDCHSEFNSIEPLMESLILQEKSTETIKLNADADTQHSSLFGSLILPFSIAKFIDYSKDTKSLFAHYEFNMKESKIQLANQIRSVGQLLIEFAGRIESNADPVEFATRAADVR